MNNYDVVVSPNWLAVTLRFNVYGAAPHRSTTHL
jgi:hypothetical protein